MLRLITDGRISPEEAVCAYHAILQAQGIKPHRPLDQDLQLTDQSMSYNSNSSRSSVSVQNNPLARTVGSPTQVVQSRSGTNGEWPKRADGSPDFSQMTSGQRINYDQQRLKRIFG